MLIYSIGQVEHVFTEFPTGVRYVEFAHGGKDTVYWKGQYGVKLAKSGVFVSLVKVYSTFLLSNETHITGVFLKTLLVLYKTAMSSLINKTVITIN